MTPPPSSPSAGKPGMAERAHQANPIYRPGLRFQAKVRRPKHVTGEMNGMEKKYAARLDLLKASGAIAAWEFEPLKLRLGELNCWYSFDFLVITAEGQLEAHETKGGLIMEDAVIKWKWAAERFSWMRFVMMQYRKGEWNAIRDSWKD